MAPRMSVVAYEASPPPTAPITNAATTTIAPYMTVFSFALSLFQNCWSAGGMTSPPRACFGEVPRLGVQSVAVGRARRKGSAHLATRKPLEVAGGVDVEEGPRVGVAGHPALGWELGDRQPIEERLQRSRARLGRKPGGLDRGFEAQGQWQDLARARPRLRLEDDGIDRRVEVEDAEHVDEDRGHQAGHVATDDDRQVAADGRPGREHAGQGREGPGERLRIPHERNGDLTGHEAVGQGGTGDDDAVGDGRHRRDRGGENALAVDVGGELVRPEARRSTAGEDD